MSLFDWSRDERKAAIRRLALGKMTSVPFVFFMISVPEGTKVVVKNENGAIYSFPTTTGTLNPLEKETMAIQRTPKEIFQLQCNGRIPSTLDSYFMVTRGDITNGMVSPEISSIRDFSVNGFTAKQETIRSEFVAATHIVFDFEDGYYTCLAFMYEKCKDSEYSMLINRILNSII